MSFSSHVATRFAHVALPAIRMEMRGCADLGKSGLLRMRRFEPTPRGVSYFLLPVGNFFEEPFFGGGTLPPARRASDSPIAIACLRPVTFLPDLPLFRVPALSSRITFATFSDAFLPYLLAIATLVARRSSPFADTGRDAEDLDAVSDRLSPNRS